MYERNSGWLTRLMLLLVLLPGCGDAGKSDDPPAPPKPSRVKTPTFLNCPKGTYLSYENFGEAFLATHCTTCHSHVLAADARAGAPVRVNLDRLEDIARWRTMIRIVASDSRTAKMPPQGKVSNEERKLLREWLDCGAPGESESLKLPTDD